MFSQDPPQDGQAPSDRQKPEGQHESAPEANTGATPSPTPDAPELSGTPMTPQQFHEQLQQSPSEDAQPQPVYGQPQQPPQYQPQYTQPDYRPAQPPSVTPQQPPQYGGGDYRPGGQSVYGSSPQQPPQYGGNYPPGQQPQHGGGGYYPQQPQPQPQPYYTGGPPMGPPPYPPKKSGLPVWAWALPLVIILLAAAGFGAWTFLSAQEKSAAEARSTATALTQANATATARAQSSSTAVARGTSSAVAQASATAGKEATVMALEGAFATAMAAQDATATAEGIDATPTLAAAVIIEPERMPVEEFIALYADPAKRPIIVDVRSSVAYAEGHIAGAVSIPDAETESRLSELPKDRLIVAYCQ